jgi:dUTP pyrophosphatase
MERPVVRCAGPGELPSYQTEGAAGADLRAYLPAAVRIPPGGRTVIPTGLRLEVPPGWEAQVRPRSGLAARNGVTVLNAPGTIDSDFRGDVRVILVNLGQEDFQVHPGDRIAQLAIVPVAQARFERAETLHGTGRGEGGFGSTGT